MSNATSRPAAVSGPAVVSGSVAGGGTFALGDLTVHRLGYGAMQITGPGVWGPPKDPDEAVRVLRRGRSNSAST